MKNFLVTGANGDIGNAIIRILKDEFPNTKVHGADAGGAWPSKADADSMSSISLATDDSYIEDIKTLSKKLYNPLIIPTSEPEIKAIANSTDLDGLNILTVTPDIVFRFTDKYETAKWLSENSFPAPKTWWLKDVTDNRLPLIIKPRHSWGSKGIEIIRTSQRLALVKKERADQDVIAQKLIDTLDQEYTCAVIRHHGEIRVLIMHRRLSGGLSGYIKITNNAELEKILCRLAKALNLEGSINVQLRINEDNSPEIFEINPRFSSTVMMRHQIGFQDLVWSINAQEGQPIPQFTAPYGAEVFRLSREVVKWR